VEVLVWSAATKYDRYVFRVPHAALRSVRPHAQQSPSPFSLTPALFQETLLRTLMREQPALATLSYDFVLKFDPQQRVSVLCWLIASWPLKAQCRRKDGSAQTL